MVDKIPVIKLAGLRRSEQERFLLDFYSCVNGSSRRRD
jgi:hypothetical protein